MRIATGRPFWALLLFLAIGRVAVAQDVITISGAVTTRGAKWLTDLEASYRTAGYTLAVGAENLFDVFPDRNSTVNSFNGIQTFPSQSPFGMNGRALYVRIGRTF